MMRIPLRLVGTAAIGFFALAGVAHADTLGDARSFQVDSSFDAAGAPSITATMRVISQNAYFYIDDRYWNALNNSQRQQYTSLVSTLASAFDTTIYPRTTAFWGSESNPGIDGDSRMTILFEPLVPTAGGYFETINGYSKSQAPQSNAREMVYIAADSVFSGLAKNFIAHEFQHLISFNQKELQQRTTDDTWLNEARSEYTVTVVGYNDSFAGSTLQRRAQAFAHTPSDSLVEWPNTTLDYAITTVFSHYLADRFGPDLMASTIRSPDNGVVAINDWLSQHGQAEVFGDVFTDWMVASYINDPTVDARYAYVRPGLSAIQVAPQYDITLSDDSRISTSVPLKEWQPVWLRWDVSSTAPALNVQISGQAEPWWGGALIASYSDGHHTVSPFSAPSGQASLGVPGRDANASLTSVALAVTQGSMVPVDDRQVMSVPLTVDAWVGPQVTPVIPPSPPPPPSQVKDGDLINHNGERQIYVLWGKYRRYLLSAVLQLYGFQNRPIISISDDLFNRYTTSNYIRAINGTKVYAVWPDGTKHWLNITPAQWDASGRDWNAIFIVNDAEVNYYRTGVDITR